MSDPSSEETSAEVSKFRTAVELVCEGWRIQLEQQPTVDEEVGEELGSYGLHDKSEEESSLEDLRDDGSDEEDEADAPSIGKGHRARLKREILEKYDSGLSQAELLKEYAKYGFHKTQIHRIVHHKGRFDGSTHAGRATSMTPFTEVLLATLLKDLWAHGVSVGVTRLRTIAQDLWRAEGHTGKPPKFGPNWMRGFNKRHPDLTLKPVRVRPAKLRRFEASVEPNVARALNGYKRFVDGKQARNVIIMDELDVSVNEKGLGSKQVAVGEFKPRHFASDNTPHISCGPFISLLGEVEYTFFVVQGAKRAAQLDYPNPMDRVDVFANETGSVRSSDADSECQMSTMDKIIFGFVKCYRGRHHPDWPNLDAADFFSTTDQPSLGLTLIVDGFQAHEELAASKFLRRHGVDLVVLSPSLTHLVQIGDHSKINGMIQHKLRELKADLTSENQGPVSLGHWIWQAHQEVNNTITHSAVKGAAASLGIEYDQDLQVLRMTNESIDRVIRDMISSGKVRRQSPEYESDFVNLRSPEYLSASGAASQGVTERMIRFAVDVEDQLLREDGGVPHSRQPRRYLRSDARKSAPSSGLRLINHPDDIARREAREAKLSAEVLEKENRRQEGIQKRQKVALYKSQQKEEQEARFQRLQAEFSVSIAEFRRSVSRYTTGNNTMSFESAVNHIKKKLKIAGKRAPRKGSKALALHTPPASLPSSSSRRGRRCNISPDIEDADVYEEGV